MDPTQNPVTEPSQTPQAPPAPVQPSAAAPAVAPVLLPPSAPDAAPAAAPVAWEQYVGHIVRWEDGTCWFVLRDGRHWIPDGDTYSKLTATKAQVFNLAAPQLDAIPDIKGSHVSLTNK